MKKPESWKVVSGTNVTEHIKSGDVYIALHVRKEHSDLIAAAPELFEAVKAIQEGFADGSIRWAKPRKADSDPYHKANTLMCSALAKAEGRS